MKISMKLVFCLKKTKKISKESIQFCESPEMQICKLILKESTLQKKKKKNPTKPGYDKFCIMDSK